MTVAEMDMDALYARMPEAATQQEADDCRLIAFYETVGDVPGEGGELVRALAREHSAFQVAREGFGTTEGEAKRWERVLPAAMTFVESLRGEPQ